MMPLPRLDAGVNGFLFRPASPLNLGVARAGYCGLLAVYYGGFRSFTGYARAAEAVGYEAAGVGDWLDAIAPPPDPAAAALHAVFVGALVLGALGRWTRPALVTAAGLSVYLLTLRTGFGKVSHAEPSIAIVLGVLAASRCGAAFSLDARRREPPPASPAFRWPVRMVWIQMACAFGLAGWQKLFGAGPGWAMPASFVPMSIEHFYMVDPVVTWATWLDRLPWLAAACGFGALLGEALFPLVLLGRRFRWVLVPAMLGMQLGIALFLGTYFWPFMAMYVFFVDWGRVVSLRGLRPLRESTHA